LPKNARSTAGIYKYQGSVTGRSLATA